MKRIVELHEPRNRVTNPKAVFDCIKTVLVDHQKENLLLLTFNTRSQLINVHLMFIGGRNMVMVDPTTLFRQAILDNANTIVVAHNHPSGELSPSDEDVEFHKQLKKAGSWLQLTLVDSIIFNETEYHSFHDHDTS